MDNVLSVLTQYATPVYRPVKVTDYSTELAEREIQVWVNAPAVIEQLRQDASNPDATISFAAMRATVSILYGTPGEPVPMEELNKTDDLLIVLLFRAGTDAYHAYHDELKKK